MKEPSGSPALTEKKTWLSIEMTPGCSLLCFEKRNIYIGIEETRRTRFSKRVHNDACESASTNRTLNFK